MQCAKTQKKSLGLMLLFQVLLLGLLGVDRFYVGQTSSGLLMLFGTLFIVFIPITFIINLVSALTVIYAIFTGRIDNLFLYPGVEFYPPTTFDFILAIFVVLLIIAIILLIIFLLA